MKHVYSHDEITAMTDRSPCADWPRTVATLKFLSAALMGQFDERAMTDTAALCRLVELFSDADRTTAVIMIAFSGAAPRRILDQLVASVGVVGATLNAYDVRTRISRERDAEEALNAGVRKNDHQSTRR